ncbi:MULTISPECIES: hypothetical protein [unclassified Duganella]|uniref:hypothetical protein n=1 Tax=unclassified Duganella TaxID=2636909 RepID=UPI000E34CCF6|nr:MULTISPECIES: hypothetical protein [unclassified Duganella]RFP09239.1 hypothetical protein D0T23_26365 [Duganella sp. BJB475]RFP25465.1 hypothetical protein D0T21_28450 [Duganella sp. BJB476]
MNDNDGGRPSRAMVKRSIADILDLVREFQARHEGKFPTTKSPYPRASGSWNAIDGALRRGAIVQCQHFQQLKAALLRRGLTPTLARLDPSYTAPRTRRRHFADILQMIVHSSEQHGGRFPLRTDPFEVRGYVDTWIAIDSALVDGAVGECPLWIAHRGKMAQLGVMPSLASLNPHYQPVRRQRRSIASIKAAIVVHMTENAGRVPSQRVRFPMEARHDSWKAICKALRSGIIEHDRDWTEFHLRLELSKRHPSLFTLIDCYRSELQDAFELTHPTEPGTRSVPGPPLRPTHVEKKPVQFGALVAQLFCLPAADADVDTVSSNHRLARTLTRSKW